MSARTDPFRAITKYRAVGRFEGAKFARKSRDTAGSVPLPNWRGALVLLKPAQMHRLAAKEFIADSGKALSTLDLCYR